MNFFVLSDSIKELDAVVYLVLGGVGDAVAGEHDPGVHQQDVPQGVAQGVALFVEDGGPAGTQKQTSARPEPELLVLLHVVHLDEVPDVGQRLIVVVLRRGVEVDLVDCPLGILVIGRHRCAVSVLHAVGGAADNLGLAHLELGHRSRYV